MASNHISNKTPLQKLDINRMPCQSQITIGTLIVQPTTLPQTCLISATSNLSYKQEYKGNGKLAVGFHWTGLRVVQHRNSTGTARRTIYIYIYICVCVCVFQIGVGTQLGLPAD
ncbi:hypothetical protein ACOSQ2_014790 [Xanthoceras sorbifolium]